MDRKTVNDIKAQASLATAQAQAALRETKDLTKVDFAEMTDRQIFELVQNPAGWKFPTIPAIVGSKYQHDRLVNAIIYFAGGAESFRTVNGANVSSRGYYHYIGA